MCLGKGALVITSVDCLLSVFTQMQDTLQRLNILIITRTSPFNTPRLRVLTTALISGRGPNLSGKMLRVICCEKWKIFLFVCENKLGPFKSLMFDWST